MDLTELYAISDKLMDRVPVNIVRHPMKYLRHDSRFLGLRGSRGVGKSTLLLQYGRELRQVLGRDVLYVSMDELFFKKNTLVDFGRHFDRLGGKELLLDEVHRYGENWSVELKNLYDSVPDLRLRFTSSSIIELSQAKGDLSRRVPLIDVYGLSFREYIEWSGGPVLPVYTLDELINNGNEISRNALQGDFRPLGFLQEYYQNGYYPFYWTNPDFYRSNINNSINILLEQDLPAVYGFSPVTSDRLKKLLVAISEVLPYQPNMTKLAEFLKTNREMVQKLFYYLHQARLISLLPRQVRGIIRTQKPEKIYLQNTNLLYALPVGKPSIGTVRETFVFNALSTSGIEVGYVKSGDFQTDDYVFEVGGKNKKNKQLQGQANAYRILDDLDIAGGNAIPIWLLGLLR